MDDVLEGVVDELKRSMPWVAFMAVVLLLIGAISLATFLFLLVRGDGSSEGKFAVLSVTYGPMVVFWPLLALVLGRFVRAIGSLRRSQSSDAVNHALRLHTQFWRAAGIVTIAVVVFNIIFGVIF